MERIKLIHKRFKEWKPLHWCWWFEKHGLPIPPYLVGGGNKVPQYEGSRISDAVLAWEAAEDVDVVDWVVGEDFCISVGFGTQAGAQSVSRTLQLRWRNVTDSGSFTALSGSGELTWSADTSLVNGNQLFEVPSGLTASQSGFTAGIMREGANDWAYTALSADHWSAIMWAVDTDNALGGKEYEFELYNVTDTAQVGVCLASLTTETGSLSINVSDSLTTEQALD